MGRNRPEVDAAAIEAVYRGRLAELRRVATAITGSREAGLDAVQDAFALAVARLDQFRGDGSLDGWVWRIVINSARDRAVADATRAGHDRDLDEARSSNGAHQSEDEATGVRELVSLLPERQRLVLFLAYYAELDYGTIAVTLGISPGTVGATLNQARDALRRKIGEVTT